MRKALAIFATAAVLTTACAGGTRPNPKREPVIPATTVVQVCVDPAFVLRYEDKACENPDEGFKWLYIPYDPVYQKELPAIGERVNNPHAMWTPPSGFTIITIPGKGAVFATPAPQVSPGGGE